MLALPGLDWLEGLIIFSSASLLSSSSSRISGSSLLGLSADLDANDSFVCWGADFEPLGLVKNLLRRHVLATGLGTCE